MRGTSRLVTALRIVWVALLVACVHAALADPILRGPEDKANSVVISSCLYNGFSYADGAECFPSDELTCSTERLFCRANAGWTCVKDATQTAYLASGAACRNDTWDCSDPCVPKPACDDVGKCNRPARIACPPVGADPCYQYVCQNCGPNPVCVKGNNICPTPTNTPTETPTETPTATPTVTPTVQTGCTCAYSVPSGLSGGAGEDLSGGTGKVCLDTEVLYGCNKELYCCKKPDGVCYNGTSNGDIVCPLPGTSPPVSWWCASGWGCRYPDLTGYTVCNTVCAAAGGKVGTYQPSGVCLCTGIEKTCPSSAAPGVSLLESQTSPASCVGPTPTPTATPTATPTTPPELCQACYIDPATDKFGCPAPNVPKNPQTGADLSNVDPTSYRGSCECDPRCINTPNNQCLPELRGLCWLDDTSGPGNTMVLCSSGDLTGQNSTVDCRWDCLENIADDGTKTYSWQNVAPTGVSGLCTVRPTQSCGPSNVGANVSSGPVPFAYRVNKDNFVGQGEPQPCQGQSGDGLTQCLRATYAAKVCQVLSGSSTFTQVSPDAALGSPGMAGSQTGFVCNNYPAPNAASCPQNCLISGWTDPPSTCTGTYTINPIIVRDALNGGAACPGPQTKTCPGGQCSCAYQAPAGAASDPAVCAQLCQQIGGGGTGGSGGGNCYCTAVNGALTNNSCGNLQPPNVSGNYCSCTNPGGIQCQPGSSLYDSAGYCKCPGVSGGSCPLFADGMPLVPAGSSPASCVERGGVVPLRDPDTGECNSITCPSNMTADTSTCTCKCNTTSCPAGQVLDSNTCQCVPCSLSCGPGEVQTVDAAGQCICSSCRKVPFICNTGPTTCAFDAKCQANTFEFGPNPGCPPCDNVTVADSTSLYLDSDILGQMKKALYPVCPDGTDGTRCCPAMNSDIFTAAGSNCRTPNLIGAIPSGQINGFAAYLMVCENEVTALSAKCADTIKYYPVPHAGTDASACIGLKQVQVTTTGGSPDISGCNILESVPIDENRGTYRNTILCQRRMALNCR